jgi:two-component system LytT family response regulator
MLKIVIVDDEINAVKTLESYISKYIDGASIVDVANNKAQAIELVKKTNFDLLLLDINLGDGTGFEVLETIAERNFKVIFCTAYDEHAIKAFKYAALDYLLKPINPEEFINAVNRCKTSVANSDQKKQIEIASELVKSKNNNKIVVNSSSEIHFLYFENILRLESDKNYTDIFTKDNKKITSSKTLKYYESLLPGDQFFRIHQKHLVNLNCIKKYLKEDGGYVQLNNDYKLEVSRRKKDELFSKLML